MKSIAESAQENLRLLRQKQDQMNTAAEHAFLLLVMDNEAIILETDAELRRLLSCLLTTTYRVINGMDLKSRVEEGISNLTTQVERLSGKLTALLKLRELYAMGQLIGSKVVR